MRKIKILTMTTSGLGKKDGISTIILDSYALFDTDMFQMDIIASSGSSGRLVAAFQNIGVNIKYLPSRKKHMIRYINGFRKLLAAEKYDAVYVHGSSAILCAELVLARLYGCKIRVAHSHNTTCRHKIADKILRPLFYLSYTSALACGTAAGKWLFAGRPFDIIKNGRNVETYRFSSAKRAGMRAALGLPENGFAIGHVGNFNRQKNHSYLIGVLEEVIKREKNVKLYLMGEGETQAEIMETAHAKGLMPYIEFTGSIDNVPDMLQAMDAMLLPSLYEGLPLVVVEWQIAGLPCIVSDTVTTECAYTKLVKFLPLDGGCPLWADTVLSFRPGDREKLSGEAVRLTRENGFDLTESAWKLQQYFRGDKEG